MSRSYHVDIARHAAGVDGKWLDNLLSRYTIPGVEGGTQGISRRLSAGAIYHIALIGRLTEALGLGVSDAVALGERLLAAPNTDLSVTRGVVIRLESGEFKSAVDVRIADGVESLSPAQRGRPRKPPVVVRQGG
jgi:hypothetical protein